MGEGGPCDHFRSLLGRRVSDLSLAKSAFLGISFVDDEYQTERGDWLATRKRCEERLGSSGRIELPSRNDKPPSTVMRGGSSIR